jgi:hypothetical protein
MLRMSETDNSEGQPKEYLEPTIDKIDGLFESLEPDDPLHIILDGFDQLRTKIEAEGSSWLELGEEWFEQRWGLVRSDPQYRHLLAQYKMENYKSGGIEPDSEIVASSDEVVKELWQRRIDRARVLLDADDPQELIEEAKNNPDFSN